MGLVKKINIALISLFLIGLSLSVLIFYRTEFNQAKLEVINQAELILKTAFAVREYTTQEVWPLLELRNEISKETFLPQAIPAYAANRVFKILEKNYPDYSYREVAVNPRNTADRPTEWEIDIIRRYKIDPKLKKMIHTREKDEKEMLYISSLIQIEDKQCLRCHTDAATAPAGLVKRYGGVNGMGWKHNEIIGAFFVSLPMSVPKQKAKASLFNMLISFITIFIFIFVAINFMLVKWVVAPLSQITDITEKISVNKNRPGNFPQTGNREMDSLVISIERLRASLKKAFEKMAKSEGEK